MSNLFSNFQYKISALILAAIFWYIVQGEEILEINRRIQVQLKVHDGYMIKGSYIRVKDATLSGSRVLLGDFSTRPIEAQITIPKGKIGRLRFRIDKEFIQNWNQRIKLTVHDAYITVYVDEKLTRTVQIKEHLQGIPAEGYIIEKTTVEPKKVVVTGLKTEISRLQHILTEPVDLKGLQKSKSFEVNLLTKDLQPVELSLEQVSVSIQVGEKKINKRFGSIPIELEGQKLKTHLRPNYVSIVVQGTPGVLSFIKRSDLRAFLDLREIGPGRYEKKVQVKIPPDTVLIETFPEHAIVEVEEPAKGKARKKK